MQNVVAGLADQQIVAMTTIKVIISTAFRHQMFVILRFSVVVYAVVAFIVVYIQCPCGTALWQSAGNVETFRIPAVCAPSMFISRIYRCSRRDITTTATRIADTRQPNSRINWTRRSVTPSTFTSRTYLIEDDIRTDKAVSQNDVIMRAAMNDIRTFPALQEVLAGTAVNLVISFATSNPVSAFITRGNEQMCLVIISIERVISGHAIDEISFGAAKNRIFVECFGFFIAGIQMFGAESATVQHIGIFTAFYPVALETAVYQIATCTSTRH